MPGWSQIVTPSRCGCLRDGIHDPMIAPGMAKPLKEARSAAGPDLLCVLGFLFCALLWDCCSLSMATTSLESFRALLPSWYPCVSKHWGAQCPYRWLHIPGCTGESGMDC